MILQKKAYGLWQICPQNFMPCNHGNGNYSCVSVAMATELLEQHVMSLSLPTIAQYITCSETDHSFELD